MDKKTTTGYITALITIVIWGTTFLSTKILLAGFTPIEIMFFSFLLGLLVLIAVYPKRLRIKDKKQEFTFAAAGLCEICYGRTMSYQF
ncbi:MAG: EamA family transporter [Lachnospiraceae bacterium]|nr:EamA family transporter [Lachnospiraceae bacterium]